MAGSTSVILTTILAGSLGFFTAHAQEQTAASAHLVWSDDHGIFQRGDCRPLKVEDIAKAFGLGVDESPKTTRRLQVATPDTPLKRYADLANYVLEIQQSKGYIPNSTQPVRRSFWQVAMEGDDILAVSCGSPAKNYLLFDVFVPNQIEPLARIGVNAFETGIFGKIEIHSPNEAELAIDKAAGSRPIFVKGAVPGPKADASASGSKTASSSVQRPAVTASVTKSRTAAAPAVVSAPKAVKPTSAGIASDDLEAAFTSASAPTKSETSAKDVSKEDVVTGLAEVVCISAGSVQVLGSDLETPLFSVQPLAAVRPVQSFGVDKQTRMKGGRKITYVKVQFPEHKGSGNIGWLDSSAIRAKSQCSLTTPQQTEKKVPAAGHGLSGDCCRFPMVARTTRSYREGMRRFRANRAGGRLHAACDLYRPQGERVVAIAAGRVIRNRYYFYQGVYALEVAHGNGFVARYGEVLGRAPSGTGAGAHLAAGQAIGFVGWIGQPGISPMLHFELYSGRSSGPLTRRDRGGFQRRSDLLDPTNFLVQWERKQFGRSW